MEDNVKLCTLKELLSYTTKNCNVLPDARCCGICRKLKNDIKEIESAS